MSVDSEHDFASLIAEMAVKIPQDALVLDNNCSNSGCYSSSNGINVSDLDFVLPPPKLSKTNNAPAPQQQVVVTNGISTKNGDSGENSL